MANKLINDVRNATSNEVAICFIAWLHSNGMVYPNCRKYALHLTPTRTNRLHTPQYNGSYNLFDLRGYAEIDRVLRILEATPAYAATKRSNGGNGVFQATFSKIRDFWQSLESGGEIQEIEILPAIGHWEIVLESIRKEN